MDHIRLRSSGRMQNRASQIRAMESRVLASGLARERSPELCRLGCFLYVESSWTKLVWVAFKMNRLVVRKRRSTGSLPISVFSSCYATQHVPRSAGFFSCCAAHCSTSPKVKMLSPGCLRCRDAVRFVRAALVGLVNPHP